MMKQLQTPDGKCLVPASIGGCNCPMKASVMRFYLDIDPIYMGPILASYWRQSKAKMALGRDGDQTSQSLTFDKFWDAALNQSFTGSHYEDFITRAPGEPTWKFDAPGRKAREAKIDDYDAYLNRAVAAPNCLSGGWCVDPKTGKKNGVRKECQGRQAQSWSSSDKQWNVTPLNMGLDFLVSNGNEFVMRQRMPGSAGSPVKYCASQVKWNFCVCEGCNCKDLFNVKLQHEMVSMGKANTAGSARCASWFKNIDATIRAYTSSVRAAIISLKNACCVPWITKNNKKGQCVFGFVTGQDATNQNGHRSDKMAPLFTPYTRSSSGPNSRVTEQQFKKLMRTTQGLPSNAPNVKYDPIRDCAGIICKNENFPDKIFDQS